MTFRHDIQNNVLYVYDENNVCFLLQETHPSGHPWKNAEEIEEWYASFLIERAIPPAPPPVEESVPTE